MTDHVDTATAADLREAMRTYVAGVADPPDTLEVVRARHHRRRVRDRATVGAVAASVLLLAGTAAVLSSGEGRSTAPPAASAPPSTAASPTRFPRMVATSLPPGYHVGPGSSGAFPLDDGTMAHTERDNYEKGTGRPNTRGLIIVHTILGMTDTETLANYADSSPGARWVTIVSRRVIEVSAGKNDGMIQYNWTERPGVDVMVTARGPVTDADVRQIIASLQMVGETPAS